VSPPREAACPLCREPGPYAAATDIRKRPHRLCRRCRLLFAEESHLPAPEAERARYATHRNGPHDAGYVAFLRQALDPALPRLAPGMRGLDFGCGHTPTLSVLLAEDGLHCEDYDPYFFPDPPAGPYDYLFATEVVEHFFHPAESWAQMVRLVKPGGLMVVMTAPWESLEAFASWGYASDETHVAFYHPETMEWIRRQFGFDRLERFHGRVFLFTRAYGQMPARET